MTIDFHPAAQNAFLVSIKYYNNKAAGLGDQLYAEVQTALALLRSFPEIGTPFEESIRKFPLNRFSFALIYKYEQKNNYLERSLKYLPKSPLERGVGVCLVYK